VYLSDVLHAGSLISCKRLIAVILLTTGPLLRADDPPATTSTDGDKIIPVTVGGRTIPIHVRDESDPFKNVSNNTDDGKYNPERIFSTKSSMADKQFLPSSDLAAQKSALTGDDQNTFITKAYTGDPSTPTAPNLNTKVSLPTTSAFSSSATGFDKAFPISKTDVGQARTAELTSATSPDQDRSAYLGPQNTSAYATASDTADANKTFDGREAADLHHQLTKLDNGQMMVTDLPNRPLTIDEVRDLINHGFKPDTSVKPNPADQSKPLNSPDYKPQPLRDNPSPSSDDDDKNDPVPPPGTMAAPENSEPLPQP